MTLNTLITCFKKSSYNEIASMQNVYGWYLNIIILNLQIQSFLNTLSLLDAVPWGIAELNSDAVKDNVWVLRPSATAFKDMVFGDSMTVCLCAIKLITLSRGFIKPINSLLNHVQSGASVLAVFFFVFMLKILGTSMFNQSMKGGDDARYMNFTNALMYTIYFPAVLGEQEMIFHDGWPLLWYFLNTMVYVYLVVILLMGVFSAITVREYAFCEKSSSFPLVDSKGDYVQEDEKSFLVAFRETRHNLLMWSIDWAPPGFRQRFEKFDDGDEE